MTEDVSTEQILADLKSEAGKTDDAGAGSHGQEAAPIPDQTAQEYEYVIEGGKKVKEPIDMILKRAGMGYNYAQKMHIYNQDVAKWKGIEEKNKSLSRWQEYDDYASKNPDWAKHVENAWASRGQQAQAEGVQDNQVLSQIQQLAERLERAEKFNQELTSERQALKHQTEDKTFGDEIQDVSKKYGVDLSQADDQGQSLEFRILRHMEALGLDGSKKGQFHAAFRDYYFDNLQSRQKEQAKEAAAKTDLELKKAGIVGVSRTPKAKESFNGYKPGMSYNELAEMAKKEFIKQ